MNRRQFTQRIAAVAAAPLLPTGLAAKSIASTAPAVATSQNHMWATFIARIHDKASPQMFKRQLSLTDAQAECVFQDLVKDKIISQPNAQGVSHAMNSFKRNFSTGLASSPQSAFQPKLKNVVKKKTQEILKAEHKEIQDQMDRDSETVNFDASKCQDESEPDIALADTRPENHT